MTYGPYCSLAMRQYVNICLLFCLTQRQRTGPLLYSCEMSGTTQILLNSPNSAQLNNTVKLLQLNNN